MSHMLNEKKSNWLLNWLVTPILKNRSKFLQSKVSARLYDCRLICGGGFFLLARKKLEIPGTVGAEVCFYPATEEFVESKVKKLANLIIMC